MAHMLSHHAPDRTDARVWQPPAGAFFAGRWRETRRAMDVHDPQDGSVVGSAAQASAEDVDMAVSAVAAAVHRGPSWPAWQRREALCAAAEAVLSHSERLARTIATEGSKTLREARAEAIRAGETLRLASQQDEALTGETVAFDATSRGGGRMGWYTREPVGVVAAVTPFNDPLNLVAHKVGPALIAGNGVVLKPAELTPLSALALAQILLKAGVPPDRLAVMPGTGHEAGRRLVGHPDVDLVSFTGGWKTGQAVARAAGPKRLLMELGGNCQSIVLADADIAAAAPALTSGAFSAAGQNCLSVQRILVHEAVADELIEALRSHTTGLVVGDKYSDTTDVGPLITPREAERVEEWVDEAVALGATPVTGRRREGAYYWPTILVDAPAEARVVAEEVFGPVVTVTSFAHADEAVDAANATAYGLQAGVFTHDIEAALDVARRLRVGAVMINDSSDFRIDSMPFGGTKRSGVGREGVRSAVEAMTEPKVIAVRLRAT